MRSQLARWQFITLVTLWVGYAGYYVCRSNLSVAGPLLQAELAEQPRGALESWLDARRQAAAASLESLFRPVAVWLGGEAPAADAEGAKAEANSTANDRAAAPSIADPGSAKRRFGLIASLGLLFYSFGKLASGIACDFVGGRRVFLIGMLGSVVCTLVFGVAVGFAAWLLAWSANRLIQSMGWGGLVKVAARWFPAHRHGTVFGVLTLSYLFGDALARLGLGALLKLGLGWRGMFLAAAGTLAAIAVVSRFTLKASPADVGAPEPAANPANVYGTLGDAPRPSGLLDLLVPLLSSFSFWLVCLMSFGLTLIRETFNVWNPIYLTDVAGLSAGGAAWASAIFPLVGGLSTLSTGFVTDYWAGGRRGTVMLPFLVVLVVALYGLSRLESATSAVVPLLLTSAVSFALLGPYSFLTGVISLDLGGKRGSSTAAGLADAAGYFGGIVSGYGIGALADDRGWSAAFGALAVIAALTCLAAGLYWYLHDVRRPRPLVG